MGLEYKCTLYFFNYNHSIQICLFPIRGEGRPCYGDSGAGLIARRNDGLPVILGVTSFGSHSRLPCKGKSIGTRVSAYIEWIKQVMEANP